MDDKFNFFFAFYGLILGLGVTEVLKGFAGIVRERGLKRFEPQSVLLAVLIFILICATWIDAWNSLKNVTLDFAGLWAPILISTTYYLAGSIVFPRDEDDYDRLADYYAERKGFVVLLLLAAEVLVNFSYREVLIGQYRSEPAVFWSYTVPYNVAIKLGFLALLFARGRKANIAALIAMLLLFLVPYWIHGMMGSWLQQPFEQDLGVSHMRR